MLSPAGIGTKTSGHSAWLDAPAAASYHRMLAAGCPGGGITDAGRTNAEQVAIFLQRYTTSWLHSSHRDRRTWLGHTYWRRVGVASAATPGESNHETGRALDLAGSALAWVRAHGAAYGWQRDRVTGEAWHIEYIESTDQHRAVAVARPQTAQPHTTSTPVPEEDDMPRLIRNPAGTIALVGPGARMTVLRTLDEVNALRMTGVVQDYSPTSPWQPLPDGLAWNLLTALAKRSGQYTA